MYVYIKYKAVNTKLKINNPLPLFCPLFQGNGSGWRLTRSKKIGFGSNPTEKKCNRIRPNKITVQPSMFSLNLLHIKKEVQNISDIHGLL